MVIITGSGRSGTSLITEYCVESGFNVDAGNYFKKINAGYESFDAQKVNQRLIHRMNGGKVRALHTLSLDIISNKWDVVKDTHFVTEPSLIKIWWHYRKDLKIIFSWREPGAVIESLKANPTMNTAVYRMDENEIFKRSLTFIQNLNHLKIPFVIVNFPKVIEEPNALLSFLHGKTTAKKIKIWDRVAQKSKVHH